MKFQAMNLSGKAMRKTERLAKTLIEDSYNTEKEVGFSIAQVTKSDIKGRFLEKKSRTIQVIEESGDSRSIEVTSINIVQFIIFLEQKVLVVLERHDSTSSFVSRLALLTAFQITIEPIKIELPNLIKFLSNSASSISLKEITGSNIRISNTVEAAMRLRGKIDIEAAYSQSFLNHKGVITSAKLEYSSTTDEFLFVWKDNGNHEVLPTPKERDQFLLDLATFVRSKEDAS